MVEICTCLSRCWARFSGTPFEAAETPKVCRNPVGVAQARPFLHHARRVQPQFDLANDHEFVIQICQMTAGLPLAIELAASWLKGSSTAHIAHAMQHNLDILSTTTRNVEERHRSMRAVFDHSWASLSDNERLIFARLSVFPGGFDRHAASQVAEASFSSLATLVEKSLVHMNSTERFGIHEMLRQYGTEQLEAHGKPRLHMHTIADILPT